METLGWHHGLSSGPESGPQNSREVHDIVLFNDRALQWTGSLLFLWLLWPVLRFSITDCKSPLKPHSDFSNLGFSFGSLPNCKFCITKQASVFTPFESLQLIVKVPWLWHFSAVPFPAHGKHLRPSRCLGAGRRLFRAVNRRFTVADSASAFQVSSGYQLLPQQWRQTGLLKHVVLLRRAGSILCKKWNLLMSVNATCIKDALSISQFVILQLKLFWKF